MDKFRIGIIGAETKQGAQLVRLLAGHPYVAIAAIHAEGGQGRMISTVHPALHSVCDMICSSMEEVIECSDVIFSALSQDKSEELSASCIRKKSVFIDLSANYRPQSEEAYNDWFGYQLEYPGLHEASVYGLPELLREDIVGKVIVAVPSPIAVAAAIALCPALMSGMIYPDSVTVVVNVPGTLETQPCEILETEQILRKMSGEKVFANVVKNDVPNSRGLLVTCIARLRPDFTEAHLIAAFEQVYGREPFVRVRRHGEVRTADVLGSNFTDVSVGYDVPTNTAVFTAALDDTVKGGAGLAVQNMNIMLSIPETTALELFPSPYGV